MSTIADVNERFALANSFLWQSLSQQIAGIPEGEDFTYITRWNVIHSVPQWLEMWWDADRVNVIFEQQVFLQSKHMSPENKAESCVRMERHRFDIFINENSDKKPVSSEEHTELKCHLCKEKISGCKCESIDARVMREHNESFLCPVCDAYPCECNPPCQRW